MKNRTVIAAILALGVVVAAPFAFAQHQQKAMMHGGFGEAMMLGHLQQAKQALGLSDDQVTQIKAIFTDLHAQNQQYRESMRGGHQAILQTLLADPNNIAGAQALIDQQTSAERAIKTNVLNATSKALNVLTADQRAKLGAFVQERMARHAR